MRKLHSTLVALVIFAALAYFGLSPEDLASLTSGSANPPSEPSKTTDRTPATGTIEAAFAARQSNLQIQSRGVVAKVLRDDNTGSRHQRFILRLPSGHTVLIAHNIDLAERLTNLNEGDLVEFYGEYEYNDKGGVVHWTHHDPNRRHPDGWLKHKGTTVR
ncbi:MAG: DUF3465 domain-containing protein [Proteobacteria bacterium]|nr:DUF3465 domain-containing protein [Pseudomonadota bacterium]